MIENQDIERINKAQEKRETIYKHKRQLILTLGKDKYEEIMKEEAKDIEELFDDILSK